MKILFWFHGSTQYFNLILSKLNEQPNIDVIYAKPKGISANLGDGVLQTNNGANFPIYEFEEKKSKENTFIYFEGFEEYLNIVKPNIIVMTETHMKNVLYNKSFIDTIKKLNIKVILKSIPFQLNSYQDEINNYKNNILYGNGLTLNIFPRFIRSIIFKTRIDKYYLKYVRSVKMIKNYKSILDEKVSMFNYFDAHVNYVEEALDIYGSYGVPPEKIFITYNSPNTDVLFQIKDQIQKEPPILKPSRKRILHLSRLVEWKRVDMLIKAVAKLKDNHKDIELIIIGEGPEREKLEKLCSDLNINNNVLFLGGVYDLMILGKYIMSSTIYVLAGMGGLSINDAMAYGLPVICSKCDGTEKYLVRDSYNGLIFNQNDQKDLESKIEYLLNNPDLITIMGSRSYSIIKDEINIHTVVSGYLKAFNYVMSI